MKALFSWEQDVKLSPAESHRVRALAVEALDGRQKRRRPAELGAGAILLGCSGMRWRGDWQQLVEEIPRCLKRRREPAVEAWLLYHLVMAQEAMGKPAEAALCRRLDDILLRLPLFGLSCEREIDEARRLIRRGHYLAAIVRLPEPGSCSLFHSVQVLLVQATCLESVGRYSSARRALAKAEKLSKVIPALSIAMRLTARRVSLAVECDDLAAARALQAGMISAAADPGDAAALFKLQQLRLAVAAREFATARTQLEELKSLSHERPRILKMALEPVERELASSGMLGTRALRRFLAESQVASEESESLDSQCELHRLRGQAFVRLQSFGDAAREFRAAQRIAEEQSYEKSWLQNVVRISLLPTTSPEHREQMLTAASLQAQRLHLPIWHGVTRLLLAACRGSAIPVADLVRAELRNGTGIHVCRIAQSLDLSLSSSCRLVDGLGVVREHSLEKVVEVSSHLVKWIYLRAERVLWERRGRVLRSRTLPEDQARLLDGLLACPGQFLSMEELHGLASRPIVAFRQERHRSQMMALLSRLRDSLAGSALTIEYSHYPGGFSLCGWERLLIFETMPAREEVSARPLSDRQELILGLLQKVGSMETSTLTAELGITRQSLHSLMAPLLASGFVRLHKRGRRSRYAIP